MKYKIQAILDKHTVDIYYESPEGIDIGSIDVLKEELSDLFSLHGVGSSKTLRSKISNKRERLKEDLNNAINIINGNKGMSSDYIIDKVRNMTFLRCKLNLIDELLEN